MRAFEFVQQPKRKNWLNTEPQIYNQAQQNYLIQNAKDQKQKWLLAILQKMQRETGREFLTKQDLKRAQQILASMMTNG